MERETKTQLYETVEDIRNRKWAERQNNSRDASEYFKQGWYVGWGFVLVGVVLSVIYFIFRSMVGY